MATRPVNKDCRSLHIFSGRSYESSKKLPAMSPGKNAFRMPLDAYDELPTGMLESLYNAIGSISYRPKSLSRIVHHLMMTRIDFDNLFAYNIIERAVFFYPDLVKYIPGLIRVGMLQSISLDTG